ncbi:hypothetical protein TYRP_012993 [Tyrophagus putrescentiae]|nr:hypothetical protein TYRP_012993 [Tyrophagus putrescentiae]
MSQTNFGGGANLNRTSSTQLNYIEKGLGVPGASSSKTKPQTVDFSALTRADDADGDEVSKSNESTAHRTSMPSSSPPSNDSLEPLEEKLQPLEPAPTEVLTAVQAKVSEGGKGEEAAKEDKSSSPGANESTKETPK